MDLRTLVATDRVLAEASFRNAQRQLRLPLASLIAGFRRVEAELAVVLAEQVSGRLSLTIEAMRLAPAFAAMAALAGQIAPATQGVSPVRIAALARLAEIGRAGSIRAAAQALGIGQPQLTRQIADLEVRLATPLLERGPTGSRLTPAGEALMAPSMQLVRLWSGLAGSSGARFHRRETALRMGAIVPLGPGSAAAGLLADLASRWQRAHPRQPLQIHSRVAEELVDGLRRGVYDVVLLDVETLPPDLDGVRLSQTPMILTGCAPGLVGPLPAPPVDLASALIALPSARSGLRLLADRWLAELLPRKNLAQLTIIEVDSIPVLLRLVRDHGCLTILPSTAVDDAGFWRYTDPAAPTLPLRLAWTRDRTELAGPQEILRLITQVM